jgi:hypothetical protein
MAFLAPFVVPLTVASTAASTALSIVGGVQQRKAGQAAAKVAEAEAASVRLIGEIEAADKRREARRLMAAQQVAFAGAGVDPTLGTPLDVLGDTAAEAELIALRAQFGRETQARAIEARGQQAQQAGRQAAIGSFVRAGGTILGGAASLGELPSGGTF